MLARGAKGMSDVELVAILIRSGTPKTPAEIGWMSHQMFCAIGVDTPNVLCSQGWVSTM